MESFEGVIGKDLSDPIPEWAEHGANAVLSYGISPNMNISRAACSGWRVRSRSPWSSWHRARSSSSRGAKALTSALTPLRSWSPQDMLRCTLTSQRSTEARVPGVSDGSICSKTALASRIFCSVSK